MNDARKRIRRALQRENPTRVLVDEQELVPQRCKALRTPARPCCASPDARSRISAPSQRCADVQRQRELRETATALLAPDWSARGAAVRRGKDPRCRGREGAVESLSGVASASSATTAHGPRRGATPDRISAADHLRTVLLREVQILEFGVHLDKGCTTNARTLLPSAHCTSSARRLCAVSATQAGRCELKSTTTSLKLVTTNAHLPGS